MSSINKLIEVSFPTNLQKWPANKLRGDSVQNIIRGKIYGSTISILQHIPQNPSCEEEENWVHVVAASKMRNEWCGGDLNQTTAR